MGATVPAHAGRALVKFGAGVFAPSAILLFAVGCTQAPDYDIMGSLFPAWLVCIALGIGLAAIARIFLVRFRVPLAMPVLVYPSLAAIFIFALWLVFYS